jgi:hypothetical protein
LHHEKPTRQRAIVRRVSSSRGDRATEPAHHGLVATRIDKEELLAGAACLEHGKDVVHIDQALHVVQLGVLRAEEALRGRLTFTRALGNRYIELHAVTAKCQDDDIVWIRHPQTQFKLGLDVRPRGSQPRDLGLVMHRGDVLGREPGCFETFLQLDDVVVTVLELV